MRIIPLNSCYRLPRENKKDINDILAHLPAQIDMDFIILSSSVFRGDTLGVIQVSLQTFDKICVVY